MNGMAETISSVRRFQRFDGISEALQFLPNAGVEHCYDPMYGDLVDFAEGAISGFDELGDGTWTASLDTIEGFLPLDPTDWLVKLPDGAFVIVHACGFDWATSHFEEVT